MGLGTDSQSVVQTRRVSFAWELVRHADSQLHSGCPELETLGMGLAICVLAPGHSDAGSLRPTED